MTRIRLLIAGDSRSDTVLAGVLEADGDIRVIAQVLPVEAAVAAIEQRPDVLLVHLRDDDQAVRTVEQVMARHPIPILVLAMETSTREAALRAGAMAMLPQAGLGLESESASVRRQLRAMSGLAVIRPRGRRHGRALPGVPVVGIAASAGGPQALTSVLSELAGLQAPVLVVQHMHPEFVPGLLQWLQRESALPVELAVDAIMLEPGRAYLAPPNTHLRVSPNRSVSLLVEPVSLHRPSADELFQSLAEQLGKSAIGVLLTGMGEDGAAGLLAIRNQGGRTIAQDEESSAIYGMPRAADRIGAAEQVLPLNRIAAAVLAAVERIG